MSKTQEKIIEIFDSVVESGVKLDTPIEDVDKCNLMFKAATSDTLHQMLGSNMCMFNCEYQGEDAVYIMFSIPIQEKGSKQIVERVVEVVKKLEDCFVTLDSCTSEEVKEDRFVYVTAIKKLEKTNGYDS